MHNLKIIRRVTLTDVLLMILGFIGTTLKGIGPSYAAKANRIGLRFGNLFHWDKFVDRYMHLYKTLNKQKGVSYNYKKELKTFKKLSQIMISNNWIADTVQICNDALKNPLTKFLVEGANGLMLDKDFGTYPYVTSSSTGCAGISSGLGISPTKLVTTLGVVKAYTTRVGEGPFPTEITGMASYFNL